LKLAQITEGTTELIVPRASLESQVPPTDPVFFNPAAGANRDVSVAVTSALGGERFCDALAGVGARGIRVAKEAAEGIEVTMVDFNREALKLAAKSAKSNGVGSRCDFVAQEARTYLHSRYGRGDKFDYVDIDPFGSPAPFFQAMVSAIANGGVVSVTATDTAALCGVYPSVSLRRYGALSLNSRFHHETAARILLNAVRAHAATFERGIIPVAAHSTRHYIRVYAKIEDGASKADASLKDVGYVSICSRCSDMTASARPPGACEKCGGRERGAGPLWIGRLTNDELGRLISASSRKDLPSARRILEPLVGVDGFPPWSFSLEETCSSLRVASVPEDEVREALGERGFRSLKQPFEKTGLKTDAAYADVLEAVKQVSRLH
jgi:tRNA (guanine26-N2/guanine27-N2)-dimethyltransferase